MTNTHRPVPQFRQERGQVTHHYEEVFTITTGHLRNVAELILREHFGDRCPDYEPGCECCRRWKLLDDLTANPYKD